jgi:hypothetical protein
VAWGALLLASATVYLLAPALVRGARAVPDRPAAVALASERRLFERLAFGLQPLTDGRPPTFPTPEQGVAALPVWDPARVAEVARVAVGGQTRVAAAALWSPTPRPPSPEPGLHRWLVALAPDETAPARRAPRRRRPRSGGDPPRLRTGGRRRARSHVVRARHR